MTSVNSKLPWYGEAPMIDLELSWEALCQKAIDADDLETLLRLVAQVNDLLERKQGRSRPSASDNLYECS